MSALLLQGKVCKIDPNHLPKAKTTPSAENDPHLTERGGYKIVRANLNAQGNATSSYDDFVWGFATPQGRVWGRPVDVAFDSRESLLISDDGSGTIWRVQANK